VKAQCTIFHARVARCGLPKKLAETRYIKLVFLHPVGYVGHVVDSIASLVRNVDTLFFIPGWDRYRLNKKMLEHVTPNLCFCIRWDLRVT
jgi:hypothetical protein